MRQFDRYLRIRESRGSKVENPKTDPNTYQETMNDVDKDLGQKAIEFELESIYSNKVWNLVDPPKGIKPIRCKWIYKGNR